MTGSVAAPFTPFRDNGYATKFSMNRMQSKQRGESKKYCLFKIYQTTFYLSFREINFDKFGEYVNYLRNHHFQYAFGEYQQNEISIASYRSDEKKIGLFFRF